MRMRHDLPVKEFASGAYLLLLCTILPSYIPNGYDGLGEQKFLCYRLFSILFAIVLFPFLLKELRGRRTGREPYFAALLTLFLTRTVTFLCSVSHGEALWGTTGWRIGYLTEVLMLLFAFLYGLIPVPCGYFPFFLLSGPLIVSVYAIIERITTAPYSGNAVFLSTIGNINWFGGFLSVFFPAAGVLFLLSRETKKKRLSGGIFFVFSFLILILGSNAIFLAVAATFAFLFTFVLYEKKHAENYIISLLLFSLSAEALALIRAFTNRLHPYDGEDFFSRIISFHAGAVLTVLFLFILLYVKKKESGSEGVYGSKKHMKRLLYGTVPLLLLLLLMPFAVTFPDTFGNGRGLIWQMATDLYRSGTPLRKLFGAGNDCFYLYAASVPDLNARMWEAFADSRLTNAHMELLTMLINTGICGVAAYLLLIGVFFHEALKNIRADDAGTKGYTVMALAVVFSTLLYHTVSFEQILSTPYLYIVMGMGAYRKRTDYIP